LVIALVAVLLGGNDWDIARLWLYLLGAAMFIMIGVQLIIYWVIIRVLEELSQREGKAKADMQSAETGIK
jgi:hypothetical protein